MNKLLTAAIIAIGLSITLDQTAQAEDPGAILSKEDAAQMFHHSYDAWKENAIQLKAAGIADFAVTPNGDYT